MAISTTAANVRPLKGAHVRRKTLALACAAGVIAAIANDGRITPADKDTQAKAHGRGIVLADGYGSTTFNAGQIVDFVVAGPVGGYSGLTPGAVVYVGDDGAPTHTAPTSLACAVGYAEDESTIYVQPQAAAPVVV